MWRGLGLECAGEGLFLLRKELAPGWSPTGLVGPTVGCSPAPCVAAGRRVKRGCAYLFNPFAFIAEGHGFLCVQSPGAQPGAAPQSLSTPVPKHPSP